MKYALILSFLFTASQSLAHGTSYVCRGMCFYDQGDGRQSVKIETDEESDIQTAYNLLESTCKSLDKDGAPILVPLSPKADPRITDFCQQVWH